MGSAVHSKMWRTYNRGQSALEEQTGPAAGNRPHSLKLEAVGEISVSVRGHGFLGQLQAWYNGMAGASVPGLWGGNRRRGP